MPQSKHTPGPWAYRKAFDTSQTFYIEGPDGSWLCKSTISATEANARLIAAAPELLEALKDAMATFANVQFPHGEYRFMGMARAAIAKAEAPDAG
jgi:hypothetical protein